MSAPLDPPGDPDLDRRLLKLEEAATFTDHTVEQLSAEIAELNRRLRELHERTESLERRVNGVVEQIEKGPDAEGAQEA
jgi:uncharacterized coiled-coil protein SlyX